MTRKELDNLTDEQLIDCLMAGDGQVVEYLFYDKCRAMFGYIIKEVFSHRIHIDELVNELYLMLREDNWRRVRKFEGRSRFTTWLSVVATRFFIAKRDQMIDSARNNPLSEWQINNIPCRNGFDDFIGRIDLYNAINKLDSPRDRFVVLALEIEGQSAGEVASVLGVTVENLYNIKRRAKERLSNILKENDYAIQ